MEVSTSVSRHKYLAMNESNRQERAHRVRVTQVDFKQGRPPTQEVFNDRTSLHEAVSTTTQPPNGFDTRVYVVEDLSLDVVEILGSAFNVDPHFFRSHGPYPCILAPSQAIYDRWRCSEACVEYMLTWGQYVRNRNISVAV